MAKQGQADRFHQGTMTDGWRWFGAHPAKKRGRDGWTFRVWAPHAEAVSVVGDFNDWEEGAAPLARKGEIWEGFPVYTSYKYAVRGADGQVRQKADPYGFHTETRPATASKLYDISGFKWTDGAFRERKAKHPVYTSPLNIYEVHLGSWKKRGNGDFIDYKDLAKDLAAYVKDMGYTAIELLPVTEHPLDDSWGYQCTGYFAPTSRFGTPKDFMWFVNHMHKNGILVLLDWVPSHFCKDAQGLYEFDGTYCYEYSDPNKREHAAWGTRVFDYGRPEVKSFLFSSARFWLEEYHIDGLRVDAVASMLYLDYGRTQYKPNRFGGRENLEAMELLRAVNRAAFSVRPNALMVAEESTSFPMITKPDFDGGLGFLFKWNMGWMNDTLQYMQSDPIYRKYKHNNLTFSMTYAFSENFILPLSHDEVVHGKASLINKMPGEYDQKFNNLRAMYAYMMAHPGKKLSFMGNEFAQFIEWRYAEQLDWLLLDYDRHRQMQDFVRDLNHFYLSHAQFWQNEQDWSGFQWIQPDAGDDNLLAFRRIDRRNREVLVICNFCPVERLHYRLGVPRRGVYKPIFCSDSLPYSGAGRAIRPAVSERVSFRDYKLSACFDVPPMSTTFYVRENLSKRTAQSKKAAQETNA